MATKVIVNSGICGFSTTITVEKVGKWQVRITLDSECEMVKKMAEDIPALEMREVFTGFLNNPVYRSAAARLRHVACPVPSGILKAVEVELGLCIPKNAEITFIKDQDPSNGK